MSQVVRTTLGCPRCGNNFQAIIEQIIDGPRSAGQSALLSGRVEYGLPQLRAHDGRLAPHCSITIRPKN
jgi:hypothetical protein